MDRTYLLGTEVNARRTGLDIAIGDLAKLCGVKVPLLIDYEAGKYPPSYAMQREVQMTLHTLEMAKELKPGFRPEDFASAAKMLDEIYSGRLRGVQRDPDEWRITRQQLNDAGEAVKVTL